MSGRSHLLPGEAAALGQRWGRSRATSRCRGGKLDPLSLRHLEVGFPFLKKLTILCMSQDHRSAADIARVSSAGGPLAEMCHNI
jgi:hypothetical protein